MKKKEYIAPALDIVEMKLQSKMVMTSNVDDVPDEDEIPTLKFDMGFNVPTDMDRKA